MSIRFAALAAVACLCCASVRAATVYADSYGFDPADATAALQAAFDSGADTVIVRDMGSPWNVAPMFLHSDQHVIFQPGVEIVAKSGAYPGQHDCLFTGNGVNNVTLEGYGATFRMLRGEYVGGEWRHGINLAGCSNVNLLGMTIRDTGGDGIYLTSRAGGLNYCAYVTIKDVVSDHNYRQGFSIISVDGLLVDNCTFENTSGTVPEAGIDFEPNGWSQHLANVDIRNSTITNNDGWGTLIYMANLKNTSVPVSITMTNTTLGLPFGVGIYDRTTGSQPRADAPTGSVLIRNCTIVAGVATQTGMQVVVKRSVGGDANEDGTVDVSDLGMLGANYGTLQGATWAMGDFNADRCVDVSDLGILGANYVGGSGGASEPQPIPEPASALLLAAGLLALRRRSRS